MLMALLFAAQAAPSVSCPVPMPVPDALAAWQRDGRALATGGALTIGQVSRVMLVNRKQARFVVAPGKPAPRATNGGVFTFDVARPGAYRVALSDAAWIDVASGGQVQSSTGHEHGPPCSGIRKIVDFDLAPGRHTVQLSGTPLNTIKALVIERR